MKKMIMAAGIALLASTLAAGALVRGPLTVYGLRVDAGTKTATAVSGAATLNKLSGTITTESLSTAAGGVYTLTLTDSVLLASDLVFVSVANGSNTQGSPVASTAIASTGNVIIKVQNAHASQAFNGTLKINFVALRQ